MLGKAHSAGGPTVPPAGCHRPPGGAETLAKMSKAKKGKNHSPETLAKLSAANGTTIYVYYSDDYSLINSFASSRKAAEYFNCDKNTVLSYARNGKVFKEQWIISTCLITQKVNSEG